jgi:hypothetical protein
MELPGETLLLVAVCSGDECLLKTALEQPIPEQDMQSSLYLVCESGKHALLHLMLQKWCET